MASTIRGIVPSFGQYKGHNDTSLEDSAPFYFAAPKYDDQWDRITQGLECQPQPLNE